MNPNEKQILLSAIRAVEHFFFDNAALKAILAMNVPNWRVQVRNLAVDQKLETEMRAKFRRLYESFEQSPDESTLIEAFLRVFPKSDTSH